MGPKVACSLCVFAIMGASSHFLASTNKLDRPPQRAIAQMVLYSPPPLVAFSLTRTGRQTYPLGLDKYTSFGAVRLRNLAVVSF
jgi:hypothetical protein